MFTKNKIWNFKAIVQNFTDMKFVIFFIILVF